MSLIVTALISIGVHLALGWQGTLLAGIVAGAWGHDPARGTLVAAGGTALGWAGLVVYSAAVAPASLRILIDTLGSLAGGIPGEALVGGTVVLGGLLGALGGGIGAVLRLIVFTPDLPDLSH